MTGRIYRHVVHLHAANQHLGVVQNLGIRQLDETALLSKEVLSVLFHGVVIKDVEMEAANFCGSES